MSFDLTSRTTGTINPGNSIEIQRITSPIAGKPLLAVGPPSDRELDELLRGRGDQATERVKLLAAFFRNLQFPEPDGTGRYASPRDYDPTSETVTTTIQKLRKNLEQQRGREF